MAMTKKLWSINALATEFGLDRRTVALRIKDIPPAGTSRGHNAWALVDVAGVLAPAGGRSTPYERPDPPPGMAIFRDLTNEFEIGAMAMALTLVYRFRAAAAAAIAGDGYPMGDAYNLSALLLMALCIEAEKTAKEFGVKAFASQSPAWIEKEFIDEPHWGNISSIAGEACDMESWENFMAAKNGTAESAAA